MEHFDILIVGAGAAGISAARAAFAAGCRSIALVDRKKTMGGVLLQCAHRGFGPELTGPEYTGQLLEGFPEEIVFFFRNHCGFCGENKNRCSGQRKKAFFLPTDPGSRLPGDSDGRIARCGNPTQGNLHCGTDAGKNESVWVCSRRPGGNPGQR